MWFRVYAVTMPLLYVALFLFWQLFTPPGFHANAAGPRGASLVGIALFVLLVAFYAVAALVPYKPWGWTLGLVAICLGLVSCLAPAAVPLMLLWSKPETRAAFCRL